MPSQGRTYHSEASKTIKSGTATYVLQPKKNRRDRKKKKESGVKVACGSAN